MKHDYLKSIALSFLRIKLKSLLLVLLIFLSLNLHAQNQNVNFETKKITIEQACTAIQEQLKIDVFFSNSELNVQKVINLPKSNLPLSMLMNLICDGKYQYTLKNKIITIRILTRPNQPPTIKRLMGVVRDEEGEPLPGAVVRVKGVSDVTTTGLDGRYDIRIPHNMAKPLVTVSFMGMEPLEFEGDSDASIAVLKFAQNTLNEVVITGFEVTDRRKSTSSIVSVGMDKLIEPSAVSLDNMLRGKVAGMSVLSQSSSVGATPKIRIRGSSTLLGNREPLWVVDGIVLEDPVPLKPEELNSMDYVNLIGNAISGLNPEDIDRIDVLKDASATALYGTKAGNGVIVITTKRGKIGKPAVRYTANLSITGRPQMDDMYRMNSEQRINLSEDMHNMGIPASVTSYGVGYEGLLSQLQLGQISHDEFALGVKKLKELNTDWYDLLYRNGLSQNHTVSVSGANDAINYYTSIGFSDIVGSSINEKGNRYSGTAKIDFNLSKKLKVGVKFDISNNVNERPHSSIDLNSYAYNTSRAISPYNEDGSLMRYNIASGGLPGSGYFTYNIFDELANTGQSSKTLSMVSSLNLTYKINDDFRIEAIGSYNKSNSNSESFASESSYYVSRYYRKFEGPLPANANTSPSFTYNSGVLIPYGGLLTGNNYDNSTLTGSGRLTYNHKFGDHFINFLAGSEVRSNSYIGNSYSALGYYPERGLSTATIDPGVWLGYANLLQTSQPVFTNRRSNSVSFFASASYTYDNRYTANVNVRADASNKLGQSKESMFLPIWSMSGRWNIDQERFMKKIKWISGLSLRFSWGTQGNVTDAHNPNMITKFGKFDDKAQEQTLSLVSLPNKGLKWEKNTNTNLGSDISLFNSRLTFSAEYYYKKGTDQLVPAPIDPTNGANTMIINYGNLINEGWELALSAIPIRTKNFMWNVTFNTGKNKNTVTNAGTGTQSYVGDQSITSLNQNMLDSYLDGSLIESGRSLNSFYSYRFNGLDNYGYPTYKGISAKDENGNVVISTREEAFAQGLEYSGKREPDFTGGFGSLMSYKNFTLNAQFSMQFGAKMRLNDLFNDKPTLSPYDNASIELLDRWQKPGDEKTTNIPRLNGSDIKIKDKGAYVEGGSAVIGTGIYSMYNKSNIRVVSANFIRCTSISLSYYFEKNILEMLRVKNANISFSVSNPFVFASKDLKGRDPEQVSSNGALPPLKNYTFSLSITL